MQNRFPSEWQRVIYRNYGKVPVNNLASVLKTDAETITREAAELGLKDVAFDPIWQSKGFVTVIRDNYDIIPDFQICGLLGVTQKKYDDLLRDYDFLSVKLGEKPETSEVSYYPLSEEQKEKTAKIKAFTESISVKRKVAPFDFFHDAPVSAQPKPREYAIEERFGSHYCADYCGVSSDDFLSDYSEEYLKRLVATGINGLWIHGSLRELAEFPFDKNLSRGWEKAVKNLNALVTRCEKFGVNVYVYLNEPRSLSEDFFVKYPHLKGQKCNGGYCLCTSKKEVKEYLYAALKSVAENVPRLKGVMTITMSENPTHCYSVPYGNAEKSTTDCPDCSKRKPEDVAAEINNIFARALKDGNGYTRLIANLWGWSDFMCWTEDMVFHGVGLLDKDVDVLCVSEYSKNFERGGVKSQVIDYSISVVGPSDITVKTLSYAKKLGHGIWAKMQANNSWECAGVPYIPAFGLMMKHVENLKSLGLKGLMTGWSLGGYTGGALPFIAAECEKGEFCADELYRERYGENADRVIEAVKAFDDAFSEFPFSISTLYFGGQNLACGNFFSLEPDGAESTMVCFTFDDYEKWSEPYGIDVYISQMRKLTEKWENGVKILGEKSGNSAFCELVRCAKACRDHFGSALNLAEFSKYKKNARENAGKLLAVVDSEAELTRELLGLICEDAKIGYEMTNHYFYDERRLKEKLLNLRDIKERLESL